MWSKITFACVFMVLITGVNGAITIDSPMNITYNTTMVDLNVSSTFITETLWFYNLDDNQTNNVTFTPNTTIENLTFGSHKLTVFLNGSNSTGSLYGVGNYGEGLYGFADVASLLVSSSVIFTINQVLRFHLTRLTGMIVIGIIMCVTALWFIKRE